MYREPLLLKFLEEQKAPRTAQSPASVQLVAALNALETTAPWSGDLDIENVLDAGYMFS